MQQPTAGQVKEIDDTIERALELEKRAAEDAARGRLDRAARQIERSRRLRRTAIRLADRYYGLDRERASRRLEGEPTYDPDSREEGDTSPSGHGKGRVTLGPDAFVFNGKASAAWLASTKTHEILGHLPQIRGDHWVAGNDDEQELEAYQQEYDHRAVTGLSDDQIQEIRRRMQRHYRRLPPALKPRWRQSHPFVERCAAFIYRNRETGALLYCTNDCGAATPDFEKIGAGDFPCELTGYCAIR